MNQRTILIVISTLQGGGAERFVSYLCNFLLKKEYMVKIITFESITSKSCYYFNPCIKIFRLAAMATLGDSYLARIYNIFTRFYGIRKIVREELKNSVVPPVVISFMDRTNVTCLIALFGVNVPIVVSERSDPKMHRIPFLISLLRYILYRRSSGLVVQTKYASDYFKCIKNKIIIGNPIPFIKHSYKIRNKVSTIISVGRLSPEKNQSMLIESFAKIIGSHPNIKLLIVGEGEDRCFLECKIRTLGLFDSVELVGYRENVNNLLLQADIFVLPSKYEGFPNALCEAISLGLPSIATDIPCNKEIIDDKHNGLLVPVGNVTELSDCLEVLINSYQLRKQLSRNTVNIRSKYAMEKVEQYWMDFLATIQ